MRKLLILLAICMMAGRASATTPVTGNLSNLGTGAASGFVRFWLRGCGGNQPRVNSVAVVAPSQGGVYYFDFPAVSGVISGTLYSTRAADGTSAGELECGGSFSMWYGMQIFTNGKGGPEVPVAAKNGATLDISNVTPINVTPVATAPSGDNTYFRLDAGNSPVTGRPQFNLGEDFSQMAAPANPPSGQCRLWFDSTTHKLSAVDSSGSPCFPLSSGGGSTIPSGTTTHFTRYTDGPNGIIGDSAASDDGTNTTIPFLINPNHDYVRHVGGAISATEIGAQINAAYALLPVTGGSIIVDPNPTGVPYTQTSTINITTSGKCVRLSGAGLANVTATAWTGGSMLNYTPSSGNAINVDCVPTGASNPPTSFGMSDIAWVNNQCSTSQGCGGTANGLVIGLTNNGANDATYDRVSFIGFGGYGYQNLSGTGVNSQWWSPFFQANGTAAVQLGNSTEKFFGGVFAGNKRIFQSGTNTGAEPYFIGINAFTNVTGFDFSPSLLANNAHLHVSGSHIEFSGVTCPQAILGPVDWDSNGSLWEDDEFTSGPCSWMFSNSGANFSMNGSTVQSNRAYTNIFLMNAGSRGVVQVKNDSPAVLTDGMWVGGTNAAFLTFMMSKSGSANAPATWSIENLIKSVGGIDSRTSTQFSPRLTSQANPNSPLINCLQGEVIFSTGSTNGQNLWECTALNTWTQQLNSGAAGMSTSAGNATGVAVPVDWSPSGTGGQNLGAVLHPWGTLYFGGAATNNFHFAGSATAARTITWQDASGTVPLLGTAQSFTANQTFSKIISASSNASATGCFLCLGTGDVVRYFNASLNQYLNLIGDGASGPVPVGDSPGISIGPLVTGQTAGSPIVIQPLASTGNNNGGDLTLAGGLDVGSGRHGDVILDAGLDGVTKALTGIGFPVVNNPTTAHPVVNDLGSYLAGQAVITPHNTTLNLAGVCIRNCATSGSAIFVRNGLAYLNLDNAGVAGDLVYISQTTDGFGTDTAVGSAPSSQYVGRVIGSVSGTLYQVDVCIGCESFASAASGAVALNPSVSQTVQGTSAAIVSLISKCPASAGSTLACFQVIDNTGANIFKPQQNGQIQIGTGVTGTEQLTAILGPNTPNASVGQVRVADTDTIGAWRNHANTGDITLSKNTNDAVLLNSIFNATNLQTTGPLDFLETTAPSTAVNHDICYADSTSHSIKCSLNNGSFLAFPFLAGDLGGTASAPIVSKIDGTSVPVNSAADQTIVTTASATGAWKSIPACGDASHGLSYDTVGHAFGCQSITGTAGNVADPGGNGVMVRTALNTTINRTLQSGTGVTVTNGTGVSGDPSFAVDTTLVATTTNTLTQTNKTVDAEGTGNVFTRPFYLEYTAGCNNATANPGSFDFPTSAAPTASCFGTTTTQGVIDFVDASTTTASGHFTLPQGWTGNMDARISWFAGTSSGNAVRFSLQTGCVADTEAVSTGPSYNTASASNTSYTGTANQKKTTTFTAIAMTNCSAGETMYFQLSRVGGDAGDTLTATAEVLSLQFEGRATK